MIGERIIQGSMAAVLLLGASACGSRYETLDVKRISGHDEAFGTSSEFEVPEGGLLVFEIDLEAAAGRRNYEALDELELSSRHPAVARIVPGLATGSWVLMGVARGQTVLDISINGEVEDSIPVEILAQEVSP